MKMPKEIKIYCKNCKTHRKVKLKVFKAGASNDNKQHARKHEAKHVKGYGGKARFNKPKKKQSRRPTFLTTCEECSHKSYFVYAKRARKNIEFI
jgi:ribosomal protein L44E